MLEVSGHGASQIFDATSMVQQVEPPQRQEEEGTKQLALIVPLVARLAVRKTAEVASMAEQHGPQDRVRRCR